ncbi:Hypothetical predicted protein [Mytilus galloprovincialis]|uniref:Endonuclease/exonuclease/phosphatase domain-containing protein n=1 Tax=Mytilus galloprovincialis TaxID=29158 RepID=A0A8B6HUG0_MYTGA|nr:Hypothetical predicted protein [Mytilus galloprovincialis]
MRKSTDRLNIVGLNVYGSNGKQIQSDHISYLDDVIRHNEPDILLIPGNNLDMTSLALEDYRPAKVAFNLDTVLLYDTKRLKLPTPHWYGKIPYFKVPGIDKNKLMYPLVDIMSPQPTSHVVKQFHCITWHWELAHQTKYQNDLFQFARQILWLSQYLAFLSRVEVLIGGNFNLSLSQIKSLVEDHNDQIHGSITFVKPMFRQMGYDNDMTDEIYRPERKLRQLRVHECKSTNSSKQGTDYFVASKQMNLCNVKMMAEPKGPTTKSSMKTAEVNIPATPKKHSGG